MILIAFKSNWCILCSEDNKHEHLPVAEAGPEIVLNPLKGIVCVGSHLYGGWSHRLSCPIPDGILHGWVPASAGTTSLV